MKFSLVQVHREVGGLIDGVWLQDHTGTIETATSRARDTEKANGMRIKVAVVEELGGSTPNYCLRTNLKPLEENTHNIY